MHKLIVDELRFYDNRSELLGNACLQEQEQVRHRCIWIIDVKYKRIRFESLLNTTKIVDVIKIGDFIWQEPSYSPFSM